MMKYCHTASFIQEDFDTSGNLLPHRVLECFQNLATAHAEELGLGFDEMLQRNLLWMVSQIRYEVCAPIQPNQPLVMESWPLPPNRLGYERCYRISDQDGTELLRGTSNWVVIDSATRKIASVDCLYPSQDYCLEQTFPDRARRIKEFEKCNFTLKITPDKSHIDHNGHVNNTHYAAFGMAALGPQNTPIKAFQIDYLREVLEGEAILLYTQKTEETSAVQGYNQTEDRMFACQITY